MTSSMVAMSVATPIRGGSLSSTDMSNDSPLPTPPQAMHDLLRNGKVSASNSGRSSLQGGRGSEVDEAGSKHRQSSSPSARAASASSTASSGAGRSVLRSSGLNKSPCSSLAVSMGASSHYIQQRNALGSQMGILHNSTNQGTASASSSLASGGETTSLKPSRPGALTSSSQRSISYQDSGTPKRVTDEGVKMSTRPSFMSLAASGLDSASNQSSNNKENINLSSKTHQRRTSAMRRLSSRRSPSPTNSTADVALQSSDNGTNNNNNHYKKSLIENNNEKRQGSSSISTSRVRTKTSSEDVGYSSRRRPLEESLNRSLRQDYFQVESAKQNDEGMGIPSVSQYVTPGLTGSARVMRSGHAPKHAAAPWSVGRSIKRIDRHHGPDKPPQRIVASQEEEEEEEEEEEGEPDQKQLQIDVREGRESEARVRWRDVNRSRLEVQEEDEELHEILNVKADEEASSGGVKSPREWHGSGSENSNRSPMIQVPLGADEDEEEDDFLQDHHRSNRPDYHSSAARRSTSAREAAAAAAEPASRRAAMQDILSAKIPLVTVNKRALGEGGAAASGSNLGLPSVVREVVPNVAYSSEKEAVKVDFMAQVRQEAARQVGQQHLEKLGNKPSKDLETKFNGYKFKKIRKAGEGGFSTVWQVRGPFAAPDPLQPGQYIDVPESDQAYFAMKQVTLKKMEKISREEVLEECNLLQSLAGKKNNEDFILRFFGWKSTTGSLKILLELGEHDFNRILREGKLSRQQIMQYWHQMLEAVHFTHEEGNIVHTDLKPANFLMANGRLKLIDFGIAQKIPVGTIHIKRDAMIGTPNYMAPETVKAVKEARKESRDARVYKAGKASDVWALGCIFYQMIYYRPPFESFHGDEKLKEILDPKHFIQYPSHRPTPYQDDENDENDEQQGQQDEMELVDGDMINVMHLTFIYDPQERITIPQLLNHAFLKPLQDSSKSNISNEETISMSRATLKEILRKIYAFTRSGELHEDDLDERGDMLFDNIRDKHQLLAAP